MPILVGIAGGTGSGKSTLARRLQRAVGRDRCALVTQDHYYRDLGGLSLQARAQVNFDHPDSIESELLAAHLASLKSSEPILMPRYDFTRHVRASGGEPVEPKPIIIAEGILLLTWPEVRRLCDLKIYVQAPADIRLARRVRRDIADRGRDVEGVLNQYLNTVRPMHEQYVEAAAGHADVVIPGEGDNAVAVKTLALALLHWQGAAAGPPPTP